MAPTIHTGILPKTGKAGYNFPDDGGIIHPLAEMFPAMNSHDFASLKASIEHSGLHQKIIHHDNKIIDGRNRFLALKEISKHKAAMTLAEEKAQFAGNYFEKYSGKEDDASIAQFVMDANLNRRQMSKSQTACVAAEFHNLTRDDGGNKKNKTSATMKELAKRWGVSERYIHQAKTLRETAPVIFNVVKLEETDNVDGENAVLSLKLAFDAVTDAVKADKLDDLLWDTDGMTPVQIAEQVKSFAAPSEDEPAQTPPADTPAVNGEDTEADDESSEADEDAADAAELEKEGDDTGDGSGIDVEGAVGDIFGEDAKETAPAKPKSAPAVAKDVPEKEVGFDLAKFNDFFEAFETYIDQNFDPASPHGGTIKAVIKQIYDVHDKDAWRKILEDFANKVE